MNNIDIFGKLITEALRDEALNRYLDIESSWGSSEKLKSMAEELSAFNAPQKEFIRSLLTECVDVGIHSFLCALGSEELPIQVLVNDENVAALSDGLNGEIYTEDGWFEKFSQHKEKGL